VGEAVIVSEPDAVRAALQHDPAELRAGEAGVTPLALDGDEHLAVRRMLLPPLHGLRLEQQADRMATIAREEVESWQPGSTVPLLDRMEAVGLEAILHVLLGASAPGRLDRARRLMRRALAPGSSPAGALLLRPRILGPLAPAARRARTLHAVDALVAEEIRQRRADGRCGDDVLGGMLETQTSGSGAPSDAVLLEAVRALLVAGYPTIAASATWTLAQLLTMPSELERVREDLDAGSDAYLMAAIRESLRRRPPTPLVARRLAKDTTIAGRPLPAGTVLAPCIYLLHHEPSLYEAPHEFRLERFLGRDPGTYTWIPFGGGIRRCVGASFAMMEIRTVVREVLMRTDLRLADTRSESVRRRAMSLVPERRARVIVTTRRAPRQAARSPRPRPRTP
jgi:cytochrome P450